jgi:hypothetical protein
MRKKDFRFREWDKGMNAGAGRGKRREMSSNEKMRKNWREGERERIKRARPTMLLVLTVAFGRLSLLQPYRLRASADQSSLLQGRL